MRFSASSDAFPIARRRRAWRDVLNETYVGLDCTFLSDDVHAKVEGHKIGDQSLSIAVGSPRCVERSSALIKNDSREVLFFGFPLSGSAALKQGGRETNVERGTVALYDSTRPFRTHFGDCAEIGWLTIPKRAFEDRRVPFDDHTAVAFNPSTPTRKIVSDFLAGLCPALDQGLPDVDAALLFDRAIDLLALMVGGTSSYMASSASVPMARLRRVKTHVGQHMHRADLSIETVASALFISSGQIASLFMLEGTTFERYLLDCRLDGCHAFLSSSTPLVPSLDDLATIWGFQDTRHLRQAFEARFGLSPHDIAPGRSEISRGKSLGE